MNSKWMVFGVAVLVPLGAGALAQLDQKITPGEWETNSVVSDMKLQGLPPGVPAAMLQRRLPKPVTRHTCVTAKDASSPGAELLAAREEHGCTVGKLSMVGGNASVTVSCPENGGVMAMHMTGHYTPTAFTLDGTAHMMSSEGVTMDARYHASGKRIGACTS